VGPQSGSRLRAFQCAAALLAWTVPATASISANSSTGGFGGVASAPTGFEELSRSRQMLVDVYFGGRKVGEAIVDAEPGSVRLREPDKIVGMIPNLSNPDAVRAALREPLPTNSDAICSLSSAGHCGILAPATVGLIFDEDRFRADIFVNPRLLNVVPSTEQAYLDAPTAPLSVTSSFALALSGSSETSTFYNAQTRTTVGLGSARFRTDTSYASGLGLVVDDAVVELDRPDRRYSAGLFWAPGLDFIGQRRIAGVGMGTQFDTRADRESLRGTPLVLFLAQPARVELLIDGRLVGSRAYETGNNILDTSGLPDGSYPVVLRIRETNGAVREERRFFVKNAQVAPVGKPLYFAYAGMLANTRPHAAVSLSDTFYYQFGTARRLRQWLAADLSIIGTQHKAMAEAGAWFLTPVARVRVAGLASAQGDHAALVQVGTTGRGRLNVNFDLRRVWSHDGRPLIPMASYVSNFSGVPVTSAQGGTGAYLQGSGSIGYRLGDAYLTLMGSLRKDHRQRSDYSIGPGVNWSVLNRNGMQLTLQADAQRTRHTTAAFAGFRMFMTSGRFSAAGTGGHASLKSRDGSAPSRSRWTGGMSVQSFAEFDPQTQLSVSAGVDRGLDSTTAQTNGVLHSRFGTARGDLIHNFEGGGATQYGLSLQSGAAFNAAGGIFGARDLEESALIVALDGDAPGATFEVLVDERPRGRIKTHERLSIFLPAYHSYKVRLRPMNSGAATYDSETRNITLYPGNVEQVRWKAQALFTVFGQAIGSDGKPVANASIQSARGIGQSDEDGRFQMDVSGDDVLTFNADARSCEVRVSGVKPQNDYASIGKVVCQ
jgi:Mat/Ecp fimbriae outer membrane usher protein